jgi:hypothetical protein
MNKTDAAMGGGILAVLIGMWAYGITPEQILALLFLSVVSYFALRFPLWTLGFVLHMAPWIAVMAGVGLLFKAGSPWMWPAFVFLGLGSAIWMPAWGKVVYDWVDRLGRR